MQFAGCDHFRMIPTGSIVPAYVLCSELTEINQKIIISLQGNKRLIRRAAMACSTTITTRLRAEGERRECIGGDVSNENPDSVNFPVDGFQRRRTPDASPRGTERKRNAELSRSLVAASASAKLALGCPLIREPLRDVCKIIVD